MQVADIMNDNVVSISPDEPASLAARLFFRHNIGSIPVCSDDGRLRGIITDRDIVLRCVAAENDPYRTPVKEIMSSRPVTVQPTDDVAQAAQKMAEAKVRRLPVVREGKVVGMLSLGDMAKQDMYDMEAAHALSEISSNIRRL